ncbi:MAG: SixA phosphatase family protein [Bacteroidota bacterium]
MRKIFLIRHAESGPATSQGGDFQRILTARGKSSLMTLGETLTAHVKNPVTIHCSEAKRTVETATLLAKQLGGSIQPVHGLYEGELQEYLSALDALANEDQILLVGHNPVITILHQHLTGTFSPFQPGTCAMLELLKKTQYRQIAVFHPQ